MANERLNPFGVDAYSKAETDAKLTPAALLSEILKADGASSGLDADLLDGQHANAFAAAGHTHTQEQINGTVPIAKGGTGATARPQAALNLAFLGVQPIPNVANDVVNTWSSLGTGYAYITTLNTITNQPEKFGTIINFINQTDIHQIWIGSTSAGDVRYRIGNTNRQKWDKTWTKLVDNLSGYALTNHTHTRNQITDFGSWLPTGGGTLTGNLIFNNNLGIYGKTTGGANAQLIRLNSSNRIEIGTEGTSPALGGTEIHGGSFIKLTPEISASTSIPSIFIDKQSNTLIYLRPTTAGGADLGDQTYYYRYLYCQSEIYSSDERMKHDIQNMEDFKMVSPVLEADVEQKTAVEVFFDSLQPKVFSYNFDDDELENQKKHFGFVAQDVEQAMNLIGLDNFTSGFLKHGVRKIAENGEEPIESSGYSVEDYAHLGEEGYTDNYGLAYSEFIAVNTYMIKKCLKRIEELEKEVEALKNNG